MAVSQSLPHTESQESYMIEVVGNDGLVHHLGPFKSREAAESWMAQNASTQLCGVQEHASETSAQTRERRSGLSAI
jgi:hypothetical protein